MKVRAVSAVRFVPGNSLFGKYLLLKVGPGFSTSVVAVRWGTRAAECLSASLRVPCPPRRQPCLPTPLHTQPPQSAERGPRRGKSPSWMPKEERTGRKAAVTISPKSGSIRPFVPLSRTRVPARQSWQLDCTKRPPEFGRSERRTEHKAGEHYAKPTCDCGCSGSGVSDRSASSRCGDPPDFRWHHHRYGFRWWSG